MKSQIDERNDSERQKFCDVDLESSPRGVCPPESHVVPTEAAASAFDEAVEGSASSDGVAVIWVANMDLNSDSMTAQPASSRVMEGPRHRVSRKSSQMPTPGSEEGSRVSRWNSLLVLKASQECISKCPTTATSFDDVCHGDNLPLPRLGSDAKSTDSSSRSVIDLVRGSPANGYEESPSLPSPMVKYSASSGAEAESPGWGMLGKCVRKGCESQPPFRHRKRSHSVLHSPLSQTDESTSPKEIKPLQSLFRPFTLPSPNMSRVPDGRCVISKKFPTYWSSRSGESSVVTSRGSSGLALQVLGAPSEGQATNESTSQSSCPLRALDSSIQDSQSPTLTGSLASMHSSNHATGTDV